MQKGGKKSILYIILNTLVMTQEQQEKLISLIQDTNGSTLHKINILMRELEYMKELPELPAPISILDSILNEETKRTPEFIAENRIAFPDETVLAVTGPFFKKDVIVVAGRPAMGKTQLLIHWANLITKNQRVLFHSLDFTNSEITNRFLANETGIIVSHIRENKLDDQEQQLLHNSKSTFKDKGLFLVDASIQSLNQLKEYYRELVNNQSIDFIFLDYIQSYSDNRSRGREQEIANFMRKIKEIAKELNVCIFLGSQLSRSVEYRGGDKRPILSDLRESGAIEEYADKVFFIYRPEYYGLTIDEEGMSTKNTVEIIIAKNSSYGMDTLYLERDRNFTRFDVKTTSQAELTWNYKIEGMNDVF